MTYKALATCIGSFPHPAPDAITASLLARFPDCPTWAQLPRRSFLENMYAQYATRLPGIVVDSDAERVSFGESAADPDVLTAFYGEALGDELESFAPQPAEAAGFAPLLAGLAGRPAGPFVKGHVTGPISFGLTVTDAQGRAALHDPTLRDLLVQGLAAQARAQCRALAQTGRQVILFIDEPYLSSFGSATLSLNAEDVISCLSVVCEAVLAEGAIPATHCCGNTDWSLLTQTPTRILSFDAYNYLQGLTLYPEQLAGLLDRGGALAWGIVPTDAESLGAATGEALANRLEAGLSELQKAGLDGELLQRRCLVTPACGLGTTSETLADRALFVTADVSRILRDRWGF